MLRLLIALASVFAWCGLAWSQGLNEARPLQPGSTDTYTHSPSDPYKFITFPVRVPANSIGFIGFQRIRGTGDNDIRVGRSIRPNSYSRASMSGEISSDTTADDFPDLLPVGPYSSARTLYVEAWSYDNKPGQWRIRFEAVHLGQAFAESFGWALAQYAFECLLLDCTSPPSSGDENIGRAISVGMSVLTRSNVCQVGTDVVVNEMQTAISREIRDARFFVIWISNFGSTLAGTAAKAICPT